jgi:rhodanese-related sulfurtransferase
MSRRPHPLWQEFLVLPLLAALLAGATYYLSPPRPLPPPAPPAGREVVPIGLAQAVDLHRGKALFLDARPAIEFRQGRIPGARPADQAGEVKGRAVVIYGSGGDPGPLVGLGEQALAQGAGSVQVLVEGFEGWLAAGEPVAKDN